MYEDFVPWCRRSDIIRRNPDGSFDAELEIGFKFLVESYLSHVELNKPKSIKVVGFNFNFLMLALQCRFPYISIKANTLILGVAPACDV